MPSTCDMEVFEKGGGAYFSQLVLDNADHLCTDPAAMRIAEQAAGEAWQEVIKTPCATVVGVCDSQAAHTEEVVRKLTAVRIKLHSFLPTEERAKLEALSKTDMTAFHAKLHEALTAKGVPMNEQIQLARMSSPSWTKWMGSVGLVPEDQLATAPAPLLPIWPPLDAPIAMAAPPLTGPNAFPPGGIATPQEPAGAFPPGTLYVSGPGPFPASAVVGAFALPGMSNLTSNGSSFPVLTGLGGFALLTVVVGAVSLLRRRRIRRSALETSDVE